MLVVATLQVLHSGACTTESGRGMGKASFHLVTGHLFMIRNTRRVFCCIPSRCYILKPFLSSMRVCCSLNSLYEESICPSMGAQQMRDAYPRPNVHSGEPSFSLAPLAEYACALRRWTVASYPYWLLFAGYLGAIPRRTH